MVSNDHAYNCRDTETLLEDDLNANVPCVLPCTDSSTHHVQYTGTKFTEWFTAVLLLQQSKDGVQVLCALWSAHLSHDMYV